MSITTRKGDNGKTSLYSGEQVWKDDLRVETYGNIDELGAFLSECIFYIDDKEIKEIIQDVQKKNFHISAELASKSKLYRLPICLEDIEYLNQMITEYESKIELKGFVIRGTTLSSAKLDICCTIARRVERSIVTLMHSEEVSANILIYFNRLSDLLFILARYEEFKQKKLVYLANN